jgi:sulfatase modifying factor 1
VPDLITVPAGEVVLSDRRTERRWAVRLGAYQLAAFPVTQAEYALVTGERPSAGQGDRLPVEGVSWRDAIRYCNARSVREGLTPAYRGEEWDTSADGYRLPTEAEWEYLCRALTVTSRPFGESEELLPKYACTWLNSADRFKPVGSLLPNEFGLFDVLGNVWEWCHDGQVEGGPRYPEYPAGTKERPAPDPDIGLPRLDIKCWRILRGGAFDYSPAYARSASRYSASVGLKDSYLGFRVVRTLPPRPE